MINRLQEDKIELPAKTQPVWQPGGVGRPPLVPNPTDLSWFTALWVLMSDGRCRGLVGRFALVCEPPLLMLRTTRSSVTSVYVFVVFSSYSGLVLLKS